MEHGLRSGTRHAARKNGFMVQVIISPYTVRKSPYGANTRLTLANTQPRQAWTDSELRAIAEALRCELVISFI